MIEREADLVLLDGGFEALEALGVFVVGPDEDAIFARGHGKGPDAGHDVAQNLAGLEHVDEPAVFGLELTVPVDFGVVKVKDAAALGNLDV